MSDQDPSNPTFGALILAGGRSSRMGTDKASLPYRGLTLLEHMRGLAAHAGASAVIVSGGSRGELPDPVAGAGPVAGLCALAVHVASGSGPLRWLVLPVDMPRVQLPLIHRLVRADSRSVCYAGRPLPLALTLDTDARAVLARVGKKLAAGESVAVRQVLEMLGSTALTPEQGEEEQLMNANTPAEWDQLVRGPAGER
jgi:molybdopterin-guanine dinucleotide biosynthesis protein A